MLFGAHSPKEDLDKRIREGDQFRLADGTLVELCLGLQKAQTVGWLPGSMSRRTLVGDYTLVYGKGDFMWPIDSNGRVGRSALTEKCKGQLVLCPVHEVDPKENEFGPISP